MTYCVQVRKLALRMVNRIGIMKTSCFTNISRVTLWRWKSKGLGIKKRSHFKTLFHATRDVIKSYLIDHPCCTARDIVAFLKHQGTNISRKSIYNFIKKANFSKKRIQRRGTCKGDLDRLIEYFRSRYSDAMRDGKTIVSVDECGFSEKIKPIYGYSPVGKPLILKTSGSWVHQTLLMAVFSNGHKAFVVQQGAIKRKDFAAFIDTLALTESSVLVIDNASIHKKLELTTDPTILFTPPYSPEFNPIELCFANVKRAFRKLNNAVVPNVPALITSSVESLSSQIIGNCFDHVWNNFVKC